MARKNVVDSLVLPPTALIKEAAEVLQNHEIKIVLVCDQNRRLLGTVTDGDIRRMILQGITPELPVTRIMNSSPKVTTQHENKWELREYMRHAVIRHLPELDEKGRVINIFHLDAPEDISPLDSAVVLMVGGEGLRLRPLTENCPKPLVKVGSKPVLERIIELFISQGFHRFYLAVNYLGHMIEEYCGDGSRWGVDIRYIHEEKPMGTAGALALLEAQEHPFIVMNGDIITKTNFRALLEPCVGDVLAVMGAREYTYTVPYGCLSVIGDEIIRIDEKPVQRHFINAGLYAFAPEVLDYLPQNQYFGTPDVFASLIQAGKSTRYFHITEEWIDIGTMDDLAWARQLYNKGDADD